MEEKIQMGRMPCIGNDCKSAWRMGYMADIAGDCHRNRHSDWNCESNLNALKQE